MKSIVALIMMNLLLVQVSGAADSTSDLTMTVVMNKKFYDGDRIPFSVVLTNASDHAIEVIQPCTSNGTISMPNLELLHSDESAYNYMRPIVYSRIPLSSQTSILDPGKSISCENAVIEYWYPAGVNPGQYSIKITYHARDIILRWEGEFSVEIPNEYRDLYPQFIGHMNGITSKGKNGARAEVIAEIKDFIHNHHDFPHCAYLCERTARALPIQAAERFLEIIPESMRGSKFYDVAQKELANRRTDRVRDDERERHSAMIKQKLRDPQLKKESQAYLHCKSISDYQRFVTTYPRSIFAPEALHELIALCVESQRDYREFKEKLISDYPDSFWGKKIIANE